MSCSPSTPSPLAVEGWGGGTAVETRAYPNSFDNNGRPWLS